MPKMLHHLQRLPLRKRLQQRAGEHRHSLDAELVALLGVTADREGAAIERIDRRRENGSVIRNSPAEVRRQVREGFARLSLAQT